MRASQVALGREDPAEEEMATQAAMMFLQMKDQRPAGCSPWGLKESDRI